MGFYSSISCFAACTNPSSRKDLRPSHLNLAWASLLFRTRECLYLETESGISSAHMVPLSGRATGRHCMVFIASRLTHLGNARSGVLTLKRAHNIVNSIIQSLPFFNLPYIPFLISNAFKKNKL